MDWTLYWTILGQLSMAFIILTPPAAIFAGTVARTITKNFNLNTTNELHTVPAPAPEVPPALHQKRMISGTQL